MRFSFGGIFRVYLLRQLYPRELIAAQRNGELIN